MQFDIGNREYIKSAARSSGRRDRRIEGFESHTSNVMESSNHITIDILHDEDSEYPNKRRKIEKNGILQHSHRPRTEFCIDIEEEGELLYQEYEDSGDLADEEEAAHYPAGASCHHITNISNTVLIKNPPTTSQYVSLSEARFGINEKLRPGKVVQSNNEDLFWIKEIVNDVTDGNITIRGHHLQRCRDLNGLLPKKLNELCWIAEVDMNDSRNHLEQSVVELPIDQVRKIRATIFTNQAFPSCSFRDQAHGYKNSSEIEKMGLCTVRWRYTCTFATAGESRDNKYKEQILERLRMSDLLEIKKPQAAIPDENLRSTFRGKTVLGGSHRKGSPSVQGKIMVVNDPSSAERHHWVIEKSDRARGFGPARPLRSREVSPNFAEYHDPNLSCPGNSEMPTIDLTGIDDELDSCDDVKSGIRNLSIGEKYKASHSNVYQHNTSIWDNILEKTNSSPRATSIQINTKFLDLLTPPSGAIHSLTSQIKQQSGVASQQRYTYGDGFCGAGGATRGAVMAGLQLKWGFDFSDAACATWHHNFPHAVMYKMSAYELIKGGMGNSDLKVDILHLSPPCQYFSPAHTVLGKDDDMNSATLFACGLLLDIAKPRIVTVEQTFGILSLKFRGFFNALVSCFTERDFSIRWKLCPLQNWGLPQRRLRLIMIASCPGEALPSFPPFTHADPRSRQNHLKPWRTVNSFIDEIPYNAPNHNVGEMEERSLNRAPWNADSIVPRCITTHGGHNYHPSGRRPLTHREFAALQGFPHEHAFSSSYVKKQIGNAVPPLVAKVIFSAIKKALEEADGFDPLSEVIIID